MWWLFKAAECYSGKRVWSWPLRASCFHNSLNLAMALLPLAGGNLKSVIHLIRWKQKAFQAENLFRVIRVIVSTPFLVNKGKLSIQEWKIKVTLNREKQEASFSSLPPSPHQIKHSGILRKLGH